MTDEDYISLLKGEIVETVGCTDPGCISFCVARAVKELGSMPEKIYLTLSRNLYKNAVGVTVPGTGMSGFYIAAALGAIICRPEDGLTMLRHVSADVLAQAKEYMESREIIVRCDQGLPPLYVRAEVWNGDHSAYAVICHDYQHIAQVGKDGSVVEEQEYEAHSKSKLLLNGISFKTLWNKALSVPIDQLSFILDSAKMVYKSKLLCLENKSITLARSIPECVECDAPALSLALRVQRATAAVGEGRMQGLIVPVVAISGSGNHGIVNFLGVYEAAIGLGATEEQTIRALTISSTLVVAIKHSLSKISAFCGCATATAAALSAAVVYLLGGEFRQAKTSIHSLLGTLSGLLCDGAKVSCAYKLSSAAYLAVQFGYLAVSGYGIGCNEGIIGESIEETVANVSKLNSVSMESIDGAIVDIIQRRNLKYERSVKERLQ